MCFSATASFGGAAALTVIGVVSIAAARTVPQRMFACIPMLFAIQQFIEGVLWLALMHPAYAHWEQTATYSFLVFAQVVWPVYVPLCVVMLEPDPKRKKQLLAFLGAGIILGGYLTFTLFHNTVQAVADHHHIRYDLGFSLSGKWYYGLLYFIPTIIAPLLSSIKRVHLIGWVFLICYAIARLLFHYYVLSVWCFFSAIISVVVLYIIVYLRKRQLVVARA